MKKLYSFATAIVFCTQPLLAQFEMQQKWHEPSTTSMNSITGYRMFDSTTALPRSTGAGQTWNFSAMIMSTVTAVTHTFIKASAAPNATLHSTATIAENMGGNNYLFYRSDSVAGKFELVGISTPTLNGKFSDPKLIYEWPISYQDSYSDIYSAAQGTLMSYTGTHTVTASGHGTITIPGGKTFTKVMQLKEMGTSTLTTNGTPSSNVIMHTIKYMYFHDQLRYPLLTVNYSTTVTEDTTISSAEIRVNYLEAVGLTNYSAPGQFRIFPNPANHELHVSGGEARAAFELIFYDLSGAVVKTKAGDTRVMKDHTIDITDLPGGLYFVETRIGEQRSTRKLIIE